MGDKWPLQHRHVLGQAIRIRSPYVDALSVTQVLALRSLRKKVDKEELSQSQQAGFIYLILCTVSGVAAGLQNTGCRFGRCWAARAVQHRWESPVVFPRPKPTAAQQPRV